METTSRTPIGARTTKSPNEVLEHSTSGKRLVQKIHELLSRRSERRKQPKRIGLFGLFGCGNLGNDGSLEAMLEFLRQVRPDAEIVCICADVELVRRNHDVEALPIDWSSSRGHRSGGARASLFKLPGKFLDLFATIRRVWSIDLLIVPGTGILDDFGERPWGMPYHLLKWCAAARLTGTKTAFVSIGAGPINHPVSRWLMTSAARLAQYRSYRDTISKEYMASTGLDVRRDQIYPDIAFSLPSPQLAAKKPESEALTVGVGVMSYSGWYNFADSGASIYSAYVDKITRFIIWLLDRGNRVRILTGETSDGRAVSDIRQAVRNVRPDFADHRIVVEPAASLRDLQRHVADTDVVVATRFHNVVCALKLGRPTISLGYAQKNDVLLADMGLGQFCQHIEKLNLDLLFEQFLELMSQRKEYEQSIRTMITLYADRLEMQNSVLLVNFL